METKQGNHTNYLRLSAYRIRGYQCRIAKRNFSLSLPLLRPLVMRHRHNRMGRQEELKEVSVISQIREPIEIVIPCKSRIRKWAFDNAYTLLLVTFVTIITWIGIFVLGVMIYAK